MVECEGPCKDWYHPECVGYKKCEHKATAAKPAHKAPCYVLKKQHHQGTRTRVSVIIQVVVSVVVVVVVVGVVVVVDMLKRQTPPR